MRLTAQGRMQKIGKLISRSLAGADVIDVKNNEALIVKKLKNFYDFT